MKFSKRTNDIATAVMAAFVLALLSGAVKFYLDVAKLKEDRDLLWHGEHWSEAHINQLWREKHGGFPHAPKWWGDDTNEPL